MRSTLKNVIFTTTQIASGKGSELTKDSTVHPRSYKTGENIIGAISAGTFFILIGAVYVAALPTSLWDKIVDFFQSFEVVKLSDTLSLPAPATPGAHTVVYNAAFQFCLGIAILQIILLVLRLMIHSPISKTAETAGNLVYWFGASYLVLTFLNSTTTVSTWFAFWAAIIIVLGISMIARAVVLFAKKRV
jgi:hypothetical protein